MVVVVVVVVASSSVSSSPFNDKIKFIVSGGRGGCFCFLKGKNTVSQPQNVLVPFKEQKQPHNHPKL